ncbi:TPA: hypothetical protein DCE37_08705 [Candidatus Latescibacteria bacterium]|nr:hypothetical protein [Candidatus Latescibacterota bacterium]
MATDAKAILSHPRQPDALQLDAVTRWFSGRGLPIWTGSIAFLICASVLSGLRLFDNDYDWINQARDTGWLTVVWEILRPIPEGWGFQYRPVQVLGFKALDALAGETPWVYYGFKSVLFAGVTAAIARFALTIGLDRRAAGIAALTFALAGPGVASALWVSDIELLAELLILGALGLFWRMIANTPSDRRQEFLHRALFVLVTVVAHRTKGSAKLIPAIVLLYLVLYRRDQLRRFLPSIALIGLTIVPVLSIGSDPVPPFAPFAEDRSQGWMWKPANLETLATLTIGNIHLLKGTSGPDIAFSLGAVLTPALLWATVLSGAVLVLRRRRSLSFPGLGLITVWASLAILSYASFPSLPEGFMARYVVVALVPASLLIGCVIAGASRSLPWRIGLPLLTALLTVHAIHNWDSTRHLRDTLGQVIVAYDRSRDYLATRIEDANVLIVGFSYGYNRQVEDSNRYHRDRLALTEADLERPLHVLVRTDQDIDNLEHNTTVQDIRNAIQLPKVGHRVRVRVQPVEVFSGLTESIYDKHIYASRQSFSGILYEVTFEQERS